MEKDYIKIYKETYRKNEILTEEKIRDKVLDFKKKGKRYNFSHNSINTEYRIMEKEFVILQPPFIKLKHLFDKRTDEFEDDILLNVIPEILLVEYENNIDIYNQYTFETLVKKLATYEATDNIHRIFGLNYDCYNLMHLLNDFSKFQINGLEYRNCEGLHEELRIRYYETDKKDIPEPESIYQDSIIKSNISKSTTNNFNLTEEQKTVIVNNCFYNDLKNYYFDEVDTDFNDFKNVFTEDFNTTKSTIRFSCDKEIACYFLYELKAKLKNKSFTLTSIGKSGKFKFSDLNNINQDNISKLKKKADKKDAEDVNCILAKYFVKNK
jgi:hypothetical protein